MLDSDASLLLNIRNDVCSEYSDERNSSSHVISDRTKMIKNLRHDEQIIVRLQNLTSCRARSASILDQHTRGAFLQIATIGTYRAVGTSYHHTPETGFAELKMAIFLGLK